MTNQTFLSHVHGGTLAREQWTHEAHVRLAWLHLNTTGSWRRAMEKVKTGINRLLNSYAAQAIPGCGYTQEQVEAARAQGLVPPAYHATLTAAFVRVIASRVRPRESFQKFLGRNGDLLTDKLGPILEHYTPALLFSKAASEKFVAPDIKSLPSTNRTRSRALATV